MKKFLRYILLISFALATTTQLLGNLNFNQPFSTLLLVALILTIFELILKPIIKLLLLPVTILTLGLIRIVINTLGFYLAVFLVSDFQVNNIHIPSSTFQGIIIPEIKLDNFLAYLATSTVVSIVFYLFTKILTIKPKIT